jgi:hypothetical protein
VKWRRFHASGTELISAGWLRGGRGILLGRSKPFSTPLQIKRNRVEMFLMGVYNDLKRSGAKSYVRKEHGRMFSHYKKKSLSFMTLPLSNSPLFFNSAPTSIAPDKGLPFTPYI